mgnify:CR=1 FL=1
MPEELLELAYVDFPDESRSIADISFGEPSDLQMAYHAIESMHGNFEALARVASHPRAGEALARLRAANRGKLPLVKIFRIMAPFALALIRGEELDWEALIAAILSLIPDESGA